MARPKTIHKVEVQYVTGTLNECSTVSLQTFNCYSKTEARAKVRALAERFNSRKLRRRVRVREVPLGWTYRRPSKGDGSGETTNGNVWFEKVYNRFDGSRR